MQFRTCLSVCVFALIAVGCATPLQEAPTSDAVLDEALPETEIAAEWHSPVGDTGEVDDDWLKTFNDPQLEELVAEALDVQNPNLRVLSAQVDRAEAAAALAGAALKPNVGLAAGLSENINDSDAEST